MTKPNILMLAAGLALLTSAEAADLACNAGCTTEHQQCVTRLGDSAASNCGDGYRVCVQRCDPQRMNSSFLESDAVRRRLQQHVASANPQQAIATP